jgi:hypothetical protein
MTDHAIKKKRKERNAFRLKCCTGGGLPGGGGTSDDA